MARIEPIAWDDLPEESRRMMQSGTATGMYSTTVPLQIIAYSSVAMKGLHDQYEATFRKGVLEPRLVELLRLHSAQSAQCEPCSASRKDDSISEEDVACLVNPEASNFTPREFAALQFFDMLAGDHHLINDSTFRALQEVFTTAEIVEMAYLCSVNVGGHRLMHTLGVFGLSAPIIAYAPGDIDRTLVPSSVA